MKPKPLLIAAGLLTLGSGCTLFQARLVPVKAEAHFTIPHLVASQVDVQPTLVRIIPTPWSQEMLEETRDRFAVVQYIIDPEGNPREAQWVEASDLAFAQAAVASVYQGRFLPARKAGRAVAVIAESRIRLDGPSPPPPSPYATGSQSLPQNQPSRPWAGF